MDNSDYISLFSTVNVIRERLQEIEVEMNTLQSKLVNIYEKELYKK